MNSLKHPSHSKTTRTIPKHSPEPVSSSTMAEEKTGLSNVVRFHDVIPIPQQTNEREKYLTAWVRCTPTPSEHPIVCSGIFFSKYPPEQMQLIRKRLKVEFWLDDQLRSLYKIKVSFPIPSCARQDLLVFVFFFSGWRRYGWSWPLSRWSDRFLTRYGQRIGTTDVSSREYSSLASPLINVWLI